MARNKIQFQKGLSERQFRASYGTEEQCRAALAAWRWPQGFVCPRCAGRRCCEIKERKLYQCGSCRHQVSLTAGTIFHSTKLDLIVWFQAIYLVTQTKKGISSLELSRRLAVTQTTAWKVQQKLAQVMLDREAEKPVGGPDKRVEPRWTMPISVAPVAAASAAVGLPARRPSSWRWKPPSRATRCASS